MGGVILVLSHGVDEFLIRVSKDLSFSDDGIHTRKRPRVP